MALRKLLWLAVLGILLLAATVWLLRDQLFPTRLPASTGVAAWPLAGQNPQRNGRSPYAGPATRPELRWHRQLSLSKLLDVLNTERIVTTALPYPPSHPAFWRAYWRRKRA